MELARVEEDRERLAAVAQACLERRDEARRGAVDAAAELERCRRAAQDAAALVEKRAMEAAAVRAARREAALDGARCRQDAWIDALRALGEARERALVELDAARLTEVEDQATRHAESVRAERVELEAEARRRGEAHLKAEVDRRRSAARRAREAVERHAEDLVGARESLAGLSADLLQIDGELGSPELQSDGLDLLERVLPNARLLGEVLGDEAVREAALLADRLGMPVVDRADVVRSVAAQLGGATLDVVWLRDPAQLASAEVVDDLNAALELHEQTGKAAVVRATGERVEPDGVVRLGARAAAGERALRRRRRIATLRERRVEAQRRHDELEAEVPRLESLLQASRQASKDAEEEASAVERLGREELRMAIKELANESETLGIAARERGDEAREQVRLEARDALAALRAQAREAYREARSQGETAIAALSREEAAEGGAPSTLDPDLAVATRRASSRVDEAAKVQTDADQAYEDASEALSMAEVQRAAARATADAQSQRLDETRARAEALRAERGRLTEEVDSWTAREAELARLVEFTTLSRDEAVEEEYRLSELERAAAAALVRAEADVGGLRARLERAEQDAAAASERRAAAAGRLEAALVEQERAAAEAMGAREASSTAEAELGSVARRRAEAWDRQENERARLLQLREGHAKASEALRSQSASLEQYLAEEVRLGEQVQAAKSELQALRERMDERYQISLAGLLDRIAASGSIRLAPSPEAAEGLRLEGRSVAGVEPIVVGRKDLDDPDRVAAQVARLRGGRAALDKLGQVNLGAIEEYAELIGRHGELVRQREDLEQSMASIRSAIAKLNRTCRQRFRDAFDRVDEHFRVAYPELVGGGKGRLSLTDTDDLLEAGVEIFVQPPGKRLQNLSLLSGGEKAMTAIALLIALFKVKPSPFCVLDEVDAPLDEANGRRFNGMLAAMSAVSQFLVVTHNRHTMECADTLYGVTMARAGVSKLVSVTL